MIPLRLKLILTGGILTAPVSLYGAISDVAHAATNAPQTAVQQVATAAHQTGIMLAFPALLLTMVLVPLTMCYLTRRFGWFEEADFDY